MLNSEQPWVENMTFLISRILLTLSNADIVLGHKGQYFDAFENLKWRSTPSLNVA